jgi:uncharacterized repeat protein (TIGR02543 family)
VFLNFLENELICKSHLRTKRIIFFALAVALVSPALIVGVATPAVSANTNVGTSSELTSAITAASAGDTISLTSDIVVSSQVTISKSITIDGNGYTISVPKPGVSEAGANQGDASTFRVFNLSGSNTITIQNIKIKGGNAQGAGINVGFGTIAVADGVTISNSRNSSGGGGGIYNGGTTYLKNSNVIRNSATYGGGFLNPSGRSMYISNSIISDNRSESSNGGGGGAENQGTMYINNSSFSNNSSTEIGGAVNNYRGTLYVSGSSFTGNIAYGSYGGGALGNNGGTMRIVSSLLAHNYSRSSGTVTAPTAFALDDVGIKVRSITTGSGVSLWYSVHHAAASDTNAVIGATNSSYSGLANGSDNSIFSGGTLAKVRNGSGAEIGTTEVYQPYIVVQNGRYAPALGLTSFAADKGAPIRFNATSGATSYYDRSAGSPDWVNLTPDGATSADLIVTDQYGENREPNTPAAGAVEIELDDLYQVRAVQNSGGSVSGASIFGDVYPANTNVTITAIPATGQSFSGFTVQAATSTTVTSNPFVLTVTAPTVITPNFVAADAGEFTVSYSANSAECGVPPASDTSTSSKIIASNTGDSPLQRAGFTFSGWNTEPNGSGTDFASGSSYSTTANLNLYAKWVASPGVTSTCVTSNANPTPTPTVSETPTPTTTVGSTPTPTPSSTQAPAPVPTASKTPAPASTANSSGQTQSRNTTESDEDDFESVVTQDEADQPLVQNSDEPPSASSESTQLEYLSGFNWIPVITMVVFGFLSIAVISLIRVRRR